MLWPNKNGPIYTVSLLRSVASRHQWHGPIVRLVLAWCPSFIRSIFINGQTDVSIEIRPRTLASVGASAAQSRHQTTLVCVLPHFLAGTLARQRLFGAALVTGLQIVSVFLDVLDNVFLLDFAFEATKCTFDRFTFLDSYFSHPRIHPLRLPRYAWNPSWPDSSVCYSRALWPAANHRS